MSYTVLVTGAGAIIGYGIINSLKQSTLKIRVVAIDIYSHAYGKYISDVFYKGILASDDGFIEFINDIIKKEKVDLIIPGIEQDLYAFYKNKSKLSCPVVMNNDLSIELSKNKLETYNFIKSNSSIQLIPTLFKVSYPECVTKLGLPFLLKPVSSYASKGIERINNEVEFDFYVNRISSNCIFQKIVSTIDNEYTVSVFGDGRGNYFDSIILKRYLSQEGATNRATLVNNEFIQGYVDELVKLLKPIGPTNIQLRMEKETPYLLEINPRISSACSIRTAFNYNEPEMCINYYVLNKNPVPKEKRQGSAIRYISDYYSND